MKTGVVRKGGEGLRRMPLVNVLSCTREHEHLADSGLTALGSSSKFRIASGKSRQATRLRAHSPNCPVAFFLGLPWSAEFVSLLC